MVMPGRNWAITGDTKYRYAYNGMEQDPEVSGTSNSYTTEFRQYDPRLGRWKSLDPLMSSFPWQSPYVAFDNNPIFFKDPKGLASEGSGDKDPKIRLSREERRKYRGLKKDIKKDLHKLDTKRFARLKHVKRAAKYAAKHGAEMVTVRRSTSDESKIIATVNLGGGNLNVDLVVSDADGDGMADEIADVGSLTVTTKVFREKKGDASPDPVMQSSSLENERLKATGLFLWKLFTAIVGIGEGGGDDGDGTPGDVPDPGGSSSDLDSLNTPPAYSKQTREWSTVDPSRPKQRINDKEVIEEWRGGMNNSVIDSTKKVTSHSVYHDTILKYSDTTHEHSGSKIKDTTFKKVKTIQE